MESIVILSIVGLSGLTGIAIGSVFALVLTRKAS